MAFIDPRQKTQEQQQQISTGGAVVTGGSTPTSGQAETKAEPTTMTDPSRIVQQNQGMDFGSLLKPFTDRVTTARGNLDSAWSKFQADAGAADPWDNTETDILNRAVNQGGADNINAARGILSRSYTGPTALDWSGRSELTSVRDALSDDADTSSITNAVRTANPTLSYGQSRFDALLARQNPAFNDQRDTIRNSVTSALTDADAKEAEARRIAQTRADDAMNVRSQASNYLAGQQNTINSALERRIAEANAQNATIAGQYNAVQSNAQSGGGMTYDRRSAYQYTPGEIANRNNVANQNEAAMWNNIADIIGDTSRITPQSRQAASLNFNQDAWIRNMRDIVDEALRPGGLDDNVLGERLAAYNRAMTNDDTAAALNYAATVNGQSQNQVGAPSWFYNNAANQAAMRGQTNLVDPNSWVHYNAENVGPGNLQASLIEMLYGNRPDIVAARQADPSFNLAQWYIDHGRYGR